MPHPEAPAHVRGRTCYVDDFPEPAGLLHAAVLPAPVAHGRLLRVDIEAALSAPGVAAILTARDIPGDNQIGTVIEDEPLLADGEIHFRGQPIALVLAISPEQARAALSLIVLEIEEQPALTDPRVAFALNSLIAPPRKVECGDVDSAWALCDVVISGQTEVGGQEHVYLETQRARAIIEDGAVKILSSTQGPYAVQKGAARVLGLPQHQVEVEVKRLGGGFGGKEDQATPWACLAALGAWKTGRPVELVLRRAEDMMMTGKRHPYQADFKIGALRDGRILAFEACHFQDAGAACDLSLGVLGRTLLHATGSYAIPNVRVVAVSCRTHLPPNTAFRGFGGPQGMFTIEAAVARLAEALDLPREQVQARNLLEENDLLPYGQAVKRCRARATFGAVERRFEVGAVRERLAAFNASSFTVKKGFALMPVCFGISFGATFLNQAGALVHVYTDGSVSVSTGGVEMGQGLVANMAEVAARTLGIPRELVRVESTNTRRIANMSASAASATTLLNGNATAGAAARIRTNLLEFVGQELGVDPLRLELVDAQVLLDGQPTGWTWQRLVAAAYRARIALSAHQFFATPGLHFDVDRQQGEPFAYHVYGTALTEVTLDCLRGTYRIDAVKIVHDLGRPLDRLVDLGQIEGALAQGLGWMTLEELRYDARGRLLSAALASYKVPDADFMPRDLVVEMLEDEPSETGPFGAKAVGEPPLMYGIGVFFALRHAMRAFRPDLDLPLIAPLTPERVLMQLHAPRRVSAALAPANSRSEG